MASSCLEGRKVQAYVQLAGFQGNIRALLLAQPWLGPGHLLIAPL